MTLKPDAESPPETLEGSGTKDTKRFDFIVQAGGEVEGSDVCILRNIRVYTLVLLDSQ